MTTFAWPLEMAPLPMLPNGMSQQKLYELLRLHGLQAPSGQFMDAPPIWPAPQTSPPFSDPDGWLGSTRNALVGPQQTKPAQPINSLARLWG